MISEFQTKKREQFRQNENDFQITFFFFPLPEKKELMNPKP